MGKIFTRDKKLKNDALSKVTIYVDIDVAKNYAIVGSKTFELRSTFSLDKWELARG